MDYFLSLLKILAIADTHFGFKFGRTALAKRQSADAMFKSFENIIKIAKKEKFDAIIHCGDVFDRSKPPQFEINRVYNQIEQILNEDIGFIVVPGNHDRARLPDSLMTFYGENFYQFNRLSSFKLRDLQLIGFPFEYQNPPRIFRKCIKMAHKSNSSIIMCHQLFYGAEFGPHNFKFTFQDDVIQVSNLPSGILAVITGHIHKSQVLEKGRVFYPGSTERTSFAETIEEKVILKLNIEDNQIYHQYEKIPTREWVVHELDIVDQLLDFNSIKEFIPNSLTPCLIRFTGRHLKEDEIKQLYIYFPASEYPFLFFSPTRPNQILRPLYSEQHATLQSLSLK